MGSELSTLKICAKHKGWLFVIACVAIYSAVVFVVPPYTPLIEPDSEGYLTYSPSRSALYPAFLYLCRFAGLNYVEITWVQTFIFAISLAYLLTALLRAKFPCWLLAVFVVVLAANVLFSSFHRSILSESLYFSFTTVALGFLIDYFRTGRLYYLATASLVLGLMIGLRPAGLGLVPVHLLSAWLRKLHARSLVVLIAVAVLPIVLGIGSERLLYYSVHGARNETTTPNLAMGIAAMLVKSDMTFSGPHSESLILLGKGLLAKYEPVHRILDQAPSLPVRAQLSSVYESEAQFHAFDGDVLGEEAAGKEGLSPTSLAVSLAAQIVMQNPFGYIRLVLLNQFGQWSIAAQNYPPTAKLLASYADENSGVAFGGKVSNEFLHPRPTLTGLVVYPAFLAAGLITLVLSVAFLAFLWRPALMDTAVGFYLGVAAFMSAMCQCYTFFISLINVWTPRFLMAVVPQIEIVALCLIMLAAHRCKLINLSRPVPLVKNL